MEELKSNGLTRVIKVENSVTVKVKDNYYKFSYGEEVSYEHLSVEELKKIDFALEAELITNNVNIILDEQIAEVIKSYT